MKKVSKILFLIILVLGGLFIYIKFIWQTNSNKYEFFVWNGEQCRKVYLDGDSGTFNLQVKNKSWEKVTDNLDKYRTNLEFDYDGNGWNDISLQQGDLLSILLTSKESQNFSFTKDIITRFDIIDSTQKLYEEQPRTVFSFNTAYLFTYKNVHRHYLLSIEGTNYSNQDWHIPLAYNVFKHIDGRIDKKIFLKSITDSGTDDFSVSAKLWQSLL